MKTLYANVTVQIQLDEDDIAAKVEELKMEDYKYSESEAEYALALKLFPEVDVKELTFISPSRKTEGIPQSL